MKYIYRLSLKTAILKYFYRLSLKTVILKYIYRFLLKTVILSGQIYIPGTRDIPGDLVFILPARYIASALYRVIVDLARSVILSRIVQECNSLH